MYNPDELRQILARAARLPDNPRACDPQDEKDQYERLARPLVNKWRAWTRQAQKAPGWYSLQRRLWSDAGHTRIESAWGWLREQEPWRREAKKKHAADKRKRERARVWPQTKARRLAMRAYEKLATAYTFNNAGPEIGSLIERLEATLAAYDAAGHICEACYARWLHQFAGGEIRAGKEAPLDRRCRHLPEDTRIDVWIARAKIEGDKRAREVGSESHLAAVRRHAQDDPIEADAALADTLGIDGTIEGYESTLKNYVLPRFGGTPLDQIDGQALRRFDADLRAYGLKSPRHKITLVKTILSAACEENRITELPKGGPK